MSWALLDIPHFAWVGELSKDAHEKTRIYTYRHVALYFWVALFYVIPLSPFFPTTEFTSQTLQWSAAVMGLFLLPLIHSIFMGGHIGVSSTLISPVMLSDLVSLVLYHGYPYLTFVFVRLFVAASS